MQELVPNVYFETAYAGVTLGAINWAHNLVLIDAPLRAEDGRAWRAALANLGSSADRLLVILDAHYDRTLGARALDSTIIGHEKVAQVFHDRPVTFKSQATETGAEWEQSNGMSGIRWAPPELTFTSLMTIEGDDATLVLESHPGPASGAIWAELPGLKTVFLGDAVVKDQPPFLAGSDLPAWIEQLQLLLTPRYQNYLLVSGRGGLVVHAEVRDQLAFLKKAHAQLEELASHSAPVEETENLVRPLLKSIKIADGRELQYRQRLSHGLRQYYLRHHKPGSGANVDE